MDSLAALFPDEDYRFHLTLGRAEPASFFAPRDASGALLAERRAWIEADEQRYAQVQPEGEPLLAEFSQLAVSAELPAVASGRELGCRYEPDILFLAADATGQFRLRAGALCFPTGWALEEKLGLTMDEIHGVVPGLNASLASPIQQFLAKLRPGVAFLRDNWGLAATSELNLHPARAIAPPTPPVALDRLWLRVEHQALVALPRSRGVAFGIRIALHRLDRVAAVPTIARGLRRALETMPAELARYKRLDAVRGDVARLLS